MYIETLRDLHAMYYRVASRYKNTDYDVLYCVEYADIRKYKHKSQCRI